MRALLVERSVPRFASARLLSEWRSGAGALLGPIRLAEIAERELPGPDWVRVRPRLSGICGSDLSLVDARTSRYFEAITSFPFVPGHEVCGELEDGTRAVLEPVLHCKIRGIEPRCSSCQAGATNRCRNIAVGHLHPGLQTGFCTDTGGGWSVGLVAHRDQLHQVPDDMSDEAAVMVEPAACAVHGALSGPPEPLNPTAVVIGAGTLGLCTIAALSALRPDLGEIIAVAKHPEQRRLARDLGASVVAEPAELRRAVRRNCGGSILSNGVLSSGAGLVYDCVGSGASIKEGLAVTAPGGTLVMIGMPGHVGIDLTGLWQREVSITGAYAYGTEAGGRRSFDLAFELVANAGLERLLSATYALERFKEAIEHAAAAGRRGAVKVAFDLRKEKRR
jgi:threonine dehydrogenase-like Zn-dependent dehydrogenase